MNEYVKELNKVTQDQERSWLESGAFGREA